VRRVRSVRVRKGVRLVRVFGCMVVGLVGFGLNGW